MVAFANPVAGHIYAKGQAHPAGTFVVTATFADHIASGRAPGVDIGNASCGAPVLVMGAGVISLVYPGVVGATTSDQASIVRVKHPNGYETGYVHLKIRSGLAVGQAVAEGYQLGTVDKIGATACHLHFGVKDPNRVEIDGWPLLAQNQEQHMPAFKPAGPFIGTFKIGNGHALISSTDTKQVYPQQAGSVFNVIASVDLKTPNGVAIDIGGNSPPLNNRDQCYLVDLPTFGVSALALRQDGTFTATFTTNGFTQADIDKAFDAGKDAGKKDLKAQIEAL